MFTFQAELTEEFDTLDISEGLSFLSLPYLLNESSKDQYKSIRSVAHHEDGGVCRWPEAVQYLLRTYAKYLSINESNMALGDKR